MSINTTIMTALAEVNAQRANLHERMRAPQHRRARLAEQLKAIGDQHDNDQAEQAAADAAYGDALAAGDADAIAKAAKRAAMAAKRMQEAHRASAQLGPLQAAVSKLDQEIAGIAAEMQQLAQREGPLARAALSAIVAEAAEEQRAHAEGLATAMAVAQAANAICEASGGSGGAFGPTVPFTTRLPRIGPGWTDAPPIIVNSEPLVKSACADLAARLRSMGFNVSVA